MNAFASLAPSPMPAVKANASTAPMPRHKPGTLPSEAQPCEASGFQTALKSLDADPLDADPVAPRTKGKKGEQEESPKVSDPALAANDGAESDRADTADLARPPPDSATAEALAALATSESVAAQAAATVVAPPAPLAAKPPLAAGSDIRTASPSTLKMVVADLTQLKGQSALRGEPLAPVPTPAPATAQAQAQAQAPVADPRQAVEGQRDLAESPPLNAVSNEAVGLSKPYADPPIGGKCARFQTTVQSGAVPPVEALTTLRPVAPGDVIPGDALEPLPGKAFGESGGEIRLNRKVIAAGAVSDPARPTGASLRPEAGSGVGTLPPNDFLATTSPLESVALAGVVPVAGDPVRANGAGPVGARWTATVQKTLAGKLGTLGVVSEPQELIAPIATGAMQVDHPVSQPGDLPADSRQPLGQTLAATPGRAEVGPPVVSIGSTTPENQVAQQINYWVVNDVQNAQIKLDGMGGHSVEVNITVRGAEAQIQFHSDQLEVRRMLEVAMPHLRELLSNEGLTLTNSSVSTSAQYQSHSQSHSQPQAQDPNTSAQTRQRIDNAFLRSESSDGQLAQMTKRPVAGLGRALDLFV